MSTDIIIVHYQSLEDTKMCVASLQQLSNQNFNIILIDSASPNKTGVELEREFVNSDNIKVILLEENRGFAYACNKGIEASTKEFIWLLNPDTTVDADALCSLCNASAKYSDVIAFGSKVLYGEDSKKIWSAGGTVDIENKEVSMIGNMQDASTSYLDNHNCDYLPGCSIFAKAEVFKENKFPECYFMYFEETDWCYSLLNKGRGRLMFVASSVIYHHTRDAKMQSAFNIYYYNRNELLFWFRNVNILSKIKIYLRIFFYKLPSNAYAYFRAWLDKDIRKEVFRAHLMSCVDFLFFRFGKRY